MARGKSDVRADTGRTERERAQKEVKRSNDRKAEANRWNEKQSRGAAVKKHKLEKTHDPSRPGKQFPKINMVEKAVFPLPVREGKGRTAVAFAAAAEIARVVNGLKGMLTGEPAKAWEKHAQMKMNAASMVKPGERLYISKGTYNPSSGSFGHVTVSNTPPLKEGAQPVDVAAQVFAEAQGFSAPTEPPTDFVVEGRHPDQCTPDNLNGVMGGVRRTYEEYKRMGESLTNGYGQAAELTTERRD